MVSNQNWRKEFEQDKKLERIVALGCTFLFAIGMGYYSCTKPIEQNYYPNNPKVKYVTNYWGVVERK